MGKVRVDVKPRRWASKSAAIDTAKDWNRKAQTPKYLVVKFLRFNEFEIIRVADTGYQGARDVLVVWRP